MIPGRRRCLPAAAIFPLLCCWWPALLPQGAFGVQWKTGDNNIGQQEKGGGGRDGAGGGGGGEEQQNLGNWTNVYKIDEPSHYRLERFLMANYNNRLIPRRKAHKAIEVLFTIGLYQIIEVNEPQQYILLNSWIVERWKDELLYWDTDQFEGIREIVLPRDAVWIPDTTLYNSLVMDDAHSRRILNVKVNTLPEDKSALVEMLYPTLYQFSCMLDLRFFPFDIQHCIMTFGSWTHDNKNIDYFAFDDSANKIVPTLIGAGNGSGGGGGAEQQGPTRGGIGIEHCIPNEGWNILSTDVSRREVKFHCCENNYTLLEFKLHIQRKPLFYLVNLIIPTSIITFIAIIGFFSSSTVNDAREEKISLGITTLLSMSILIFMVSDQMPSTSSFIPLIGWFYTSMMGLISGGTLAASFVIYVQKKGIIGQRPSRNTMRWARLLGRLIWLEMPLLMKQAYAIKAKQDKMQKMRQQMELQRQKCQSGGNPFGGTPPRRPTWFQQKWQAAKANNNQQSSRESSMATGLGPLISRYRTESAGTANGRAGGGTPLATTFVGPTLGSAMAFLVPAGTKKRLGSPPPLNQQKVSTADSLAGSMTVSFLDAPAQTHSYNSINEEEGDEGMSETSRSTEREEGAAEAGPKMPVTREGSGESLNLIDMDEEEATIKEGEEDEGGGEDDGGEDGRGGEEGDGEVERGKQPAAPPTRKAGTTGISFRDEEVPNSQEEGGHGADGRMNLANPLVANAAAIHPMTQFAQTMLQRVQQRERDRILSEVETTRRRQASQHKPSMFRRSASSIADLYAASLFPPTPSESALGAINPLEATTATLTEASASLAALHPQVQRNLAEIEYDWLAAVLERMFLFLFSFLFFFLSFGINGIGLYYWYFTYVDMVEKS